MTHPLSDLAQRLYDSPILFVKFWWLVTIASNCIINHYHKYHSIGYHVCIATSHSHARPNTMLSIQLRPIQPSSLFHALFHIASDCIIKSFSDRPSRKRCEILLLPKSYVGFDKKMEFSISLSNYEKMAMNLPGPDEKSISTHFASDSRRGQK